ncbi:STAS domain-containing protein [uncultured Tateyamaria sp.]|uniref:STAS domain-containing protein n=1 Tax=uncultured Tateyamaria sp. TaxID=455651 RepID=UPI0026287EDA|nr:STAS domain-containing protein [uncultured Tateyamaria sp.]
MSDVVVLPARLDVTGVGDVHAHLRAVAAGGVVRVDASNVTHMGALGAQLLLSAGKTARDAGGGLDLVHVSARALDQLADMGLTPENLMEGAT